MTENEQTPTAGDAPAPPDAENLTPADEAGAQSDNAPQGAPGQPGSGRRRRRRRGRRGRGGQPGQPGQPGQASAPNGQPVTANGSTAAAPNGAPQPQPQAETTEEVEGVLQY